MKFSNSRSVSKESIALIATVLLWRQAMAPAQDATPSTPVAGGGNKSSAAVALVAPTLPPPFEARLTAPGGAPDFAQTHTVDGVTMHLPRTTLDKQKLSIVTDGNTFVYFPDKWLFAPDGSILHFAKGAGVFGGYIDARWPYVTFVHQGTLREAPPEATGRFQEDLLFKNVAVPKELYEPIEINQSVTTARGTKVTLLRITRKMGNDGVVVGPNEYLYIEARVDIPSQSPVTSVQLDSRGVETAGGGWKGGYRGSVGGEPRFTVFPLPPDSVRALNVALNLTEEAPHLRDPQWQRRFQFNIKLPTVPPARAAPEMSQEGRTEDDGPFRMWLANDMVNATLDDSIGIYNILGVTLWLRDKLQPADPHRFWFVKDAVARDHVTKKAFWHYKGFVAPEELKRTLPQGFLLESLQLKSRWKADGELAAPNERGERVTFATGSMKRPTKYDAEFNLVAARALSHSLLFDKIPVPPKGEVVTPNLVRQSSDGARVTLTTVRHMPEQESSWDLRPDGPGYHRPGEFELTFKCDTVLPQPEYTHLRALVAIDGKGYNLPVIQSANISPAPQKTVWRVVTQDLPTDTTSFAMQLLLNEYAYTGQTTTLLFRDVLGPAD